MTHAEFVPTTFVRMLKLDEPTRTPGMTCPACGPSMLRHPARSRSRRRSRLVGAIIDEYLGASEIDFSAVGPHEWLATRDPSANRASMRCISSTRTVRRWRRGRPGVVWWEGRPAFT